MPHYLGEERSVDGRGESSEANVALELTGTTQFQYLVHILRRYQRVKSAGGTRNHVRASNLRLPYNHRSSVVM